MGNRYFGKPIRRNEDPRLLTGQAVFTDDVHQPGMLHVAFVRSDYAHVLLHTIDTTEAKSLPGVVAFYTAADLGAYWKPGPLLLLPPPLEDTIFHQRTQVPLATATVSHVGEPIAVVVAHSRYIAEVAAQRVLGDFGLLNAVVKVEFALKPDAPII